MIEQGDGAAGLIGASRLYVPAAERARSTHCGSVEAWEALLERSRAHPDEFWAETARELEWMRPWDVVQEGGFPHFKYIFTDVLPKTPSGKIMRRLLKEIMATGEVGSDVTALEDITAVDKLKALVRPAS